MQGFFFLRGAKCTKAQRHEEEKNVGMNKQIVESCSGEITEQVAGKPAEMALDSGCMFRQLTCDVK